METNTSQPELLRHSGLCYLFIQQTVLGIPLVPIKKIMVTPLEGLTVWGVGGVAD